MRQTLLITDGEGWYQERGKAAQLLKKGDVIIIPADVEHWHGATSDSHMTHLAVTDFSEDNCVTWLEAVSDEEYSKPDRHPDTMTALYGISENT